MPDDDERAKDSSTKYEGTWTSENDVRPVESRRGEDKSVTPSQDDLPSIPMPPQGLIKSAFWTRLSYKAQAAAIRAYNETYRAVSDTVREKAAFNYAAVELERSIRVLEDSDKIHATDEAVRRHNLIQAEDDLEEAEHRRYLRRKQREMERAQADRRYNAFLNTESPDATTNLSDDEQEIVDAFESNVGGPERVRAAMERIVENNIKSKGDKLSPEDEAQAAAMRAAIEQRLSDAYGR